MLFVLVSTLQTSVHLSGENIARKGDAIHLNCSTDSVPTDKAMNIQINEASHNYIRLRNGVCFSSVSGGRCSSDVCQCSTKGLWFGYTYLAEHAEGLINITCAMVFGSRGLFSDTIQVQILEFRGPLLTTNATFPLVANSVVSFTCKVEQTFRKMKVQWECLGNDTRTDRMSTKYASVIKRIAYLRFDNQKCECIVDIDGYITVASIKIKISKNPIIFLEESVSCTSDLSVMLSCIISNELPEYGFDSWIHYYDGMLIRNLTGQTNGNRSTLIIDSCSQEDTGSYTCIAWNQYSGGTIYANKTVSLTVHKLRGSFEIQSVIFGVVAIGIFILTGTGTVIVSARRKFSNTIHIVGPHELSPSIPIYHSAPTSENIPQIYDVTNSGFLEIIDDSLQQNPSLESDEDIKSDTVYEEID
ncbi:HMCN [Mytilus coruscus]|uniref:HMCN n=1 Tax=Mytilus coruscus TaxID=42192 RepID=A0A6J8EA99_MYTCO|nr:HMCN [Mytilus coruscus]